MRWTGMNEQRACLRMEILFCLSPLTTHGKSASGAAHASWCVYNYAVIKLIYDEKTRDRVADNFYHLNGCFSLTGKSLKTIQIASDVAY